MRIIWTIKDLAEIAKARRQNKFDVIVAVSGARGDGKSSLLYQFFLRFKEFRPWKQQVYSRKDVMQLLEGSKFGCIFDDEAIRTGYKRNFFDSDQKLLIQMLNMYRDNFNVYALAVPNFYSLDRDLRDLIRIHIHIIERGFGVVHIANEGILYSDDCWDIKYNKKVEESWAKTKQRNPNYRPKYNRLTTFRGYIKFKDLTEKQRKLYEEIKSTKRKIVYEAEIKEVEQKSFIQKVYKTLLQYRLTREGLKQLCLTEGKKYHAVNTTLNQMLTDDGIDDTLSSYFKRKNSPEENSELSSDSKPSRFIKVT